MVNNLYDFDDGDYDDVERDNAEWEDTPDLSFEANGDATSNGCVMCGNQWKSLNKKGYCSLCWTVWNS